MSFLRLLLVLCGLLAIRLGAQDETPPTPPMREVSPGIFEIGQIRLDQKARTVTFPATVNKADKDDLLEYLLVTKDGQTHESLLLTTVQPTDLHFAMLLLGAKGAGEKVPAPNQFSGGQINAETLKRAPKLTGDSIQISAKWKAAGGAEKSAPIEDWLFNLEKKKPVTRGPWLYTGSAFLEGKFRAQHEGCFAALVVYPPALINNPREGNHQDDIWAVNAKAVPPLDTPLELTIKLETPPSEIAPAQ
jgi:hypothetical protein